MAQLDVRELYKSFPPDVRAVDGVSFTAEEGEIICLLGPSGCGKTTLLRMVAGLERPDRGEIWYEGREVAAVPPHLRNFGMMFQDFALFPHKNVYENVAFGLRMHNNSRRDIEQRVEEMLRLVELEGLGERSIHQLSGGQQQRVALARALAPGPGLLLLDEPLGALDRALRERLMLQVRTILKQVGVTALYVTHDQTEAFAIADRVAVMNVGRIEQLDTPERMYQQLATPFVAQFLGFQNLIAGNIVRAGEVETAIGHFRLDTFARTVGEDVVVLIRPSVEEIVMAGEQTDSNTINQIVGVVEAVAFRGRYYQVWIRAEERGSRGAEEQRRKGDWRLEAKRLGDWETGVGKQQRLLFELTERGGVQVSERVLIRLTDEQMIIV